MSESKFESFLDNSGVVAEEAAKHAAKINLKAQLKTQLQDFGVSVVRDMQYPMLTPDMRPSEVENSLRSVNNNITSLSYKIQSLMATMAMLVDSF